MARAVAALPQAERDFFEGMVADERAAAAEAERIAKVRAMSDFDAVQVALKRASEGWCLDGLPGRLLRELEEAGFVRRPANVKTKPHEFFEAVRSGMIHRDALGAA